METMRGSKVAGTLITVRADDTVPGPTWRAVREPTRPQQEETLMESSERAFNLTRRTFCVSFGAGLTMLGMASISGAALKKVPTSTGIDAAFAAFVVAAKHKIFEK